MHQQLQTLSVLYCEAFYVSRKSFLQVSTFFSSLLYSSTDGTFTWPSS
ncbi:hypothetical protein [Salibacterium sp. K-3]